MVVPSLDSAVSVPSYTPVDALLAASISTVMSSSSPDDMSKPDGVADAVSTSTSKETSTSSSVRSPSFSSSTVTDLDLPRATVIEDGTPLNAIESTSVPPPPPLVVSASSSSLFPEELFVCVLNFASVSLISYVWPTLSTSVPLMR